MGGAQRYPSIATHEDDGYRCAPPILQAESEIVALGRKNPSPLRSHRFRRVRLRQRMRVRIHQTHLRDTAARFARVIPLTSRPLQLEGAGKTGCALHPRSRASNVADGFRSALPIGVAFASLIPAPRRLDEAAIMRRADQDLVHAYPCRHAGDEGDGAAAIFRLQHFRLL